MLLLKRSVPTSSFHFPGIAKQFRNLVVSVSMIYIGLVSAGLYQFTQLGDYLIFYTYILQGSLSSNHFTLSSRDYFMRLNLCSAANVFIIFLLIQHKFQGFNEFSISETEDDFG